MNHWTNKRLKKIRYKEFLHCWELFKEDLTRMLELGDTDYKSLYERHPKIRVGFRRALYAIEKDHLR